MVEKFNILLCFDTNYNAQAEVTIFSLIENTNEMLTFYILHDEPKTFNPNIERIKASPKVLDLNIYQFVKRDNIEFPNFDQSHMTEATYYRLFISDFLPNNIKNIMYIDPDIICVNNFDRLFKNSFEILDRSDFVLSARTEHFEALTSETTNRLELTRNKYFNAGVTFINLERWNSEKYTEKLANHMNYLGDRVMWFDQDVLNSFLNGMYVELPTQLNFTDINLSKSEVKEEAVFFHYWGKKKPWTVKGMLFYGESFYQEMYRKLNHNYHIVHRYKKDSIVHLLNLIFSLKILKLKRPFLYLKNFIITLLID